MKLKYLATISLAGILLASCNLKIETLEQYPLDKESEGTYFKNASQLQVYTNGFYGNIFSGPFHDGAYDLLLSTNPSKLVRGGNNRTTPSSGGGWSFGTLSSINAMLDQLKAGRCEDKETALEYEGIGRFFRAYYYYKMVRDFGDMPWYDHELDESETSELYKARDSRDYIMEKMIEDVDFAIEHMSESKSLYRVTKWTAMAFKSRFLLFEGTWRKYHGNVNPLNGETFEHDADYYLGLCAEVSKDFIENAPYSIYNTGNPAMDYFHVFNQMTANTQETILAKSYSLTQQVSHFATYSTFASDATTPSFSKKFVDCFLMKDGTRFTDKAGWETKEFYDEVKDRDPRLAQIIRTPGYMREGTDSTLVPDFAQGFTGYQPVKYCLSWKDYDSWSWGPQANDMPIYRTAEVYLNYLEAQAERSDYDITDADLTLALKPIRDRAGMPTPTVAGMDANPDNTYMGSAKYGYSNVTGKHKGTILEIRRERIVELAKEGDFRWYDLMRYKQGKCLEQDVCGMYFSSLGPKDFDHRTDASGNTRDDVYIWKNGDATHGSKTGAADGVPAIEVGTGFLVLSGGNKGYIHPYTNIKISFDEERDYLYPLPTDEIAINPNLVQNPGWKSSQKK